MSRLLSMTTVLTWQYWLHTASTLRSSRVDHLLWGTYFAWQSSSVTLYCLNLLHYCQLNVLAVLRLWWNTELLKRSHWRSVSCESFTSNYFLSAHLPLWRSQTMSGGHTSHCDHFHISQNWSDLFLHQTGKEIRPEVVSRSSRTC